MEEITDELNKKRILFLLNNILCYSGTNLPLQNCVSIEKKTYTKLKNIHINFMLKTMK